VWQRAVQQSRKRVVKWVSHCAVHGSVQFSNRCSASHTVVEAVSSAAVQQCGHGAELSVGMGSTIEWDTCM